MNCSCCRPALHMPGGHRSLAESKSSPSEPSQNTGHMAGLSTTACQARHGHRTRLVIQCMDPGDGPWVWRSDLQLSVVVKPCRRSLLKRLLSTATTSAGCPVLVRRRSEDDSPSLCYQSLELLNYCNVLCYGITDEPAVTSKCCHQTSDGHQVMWSYLACAPPAALASCAAAHRVQDCDSRPPVLLLQRPRLTGQRLSARCRPRVRELRSADNRTLVVSRMCSSFWDRTFAAAGPQVWNSLLPNIRLSGLSYGQFRRLLNWRHFYSDSEATA